MSNSVNYSSNTQARPDARTLTNGHLDCEKSKTDSPLPSRARKTFWGLKDRWWMQIIDGSAHHRGPLAFDSGEKRAESGFLRGIKRGCEFVYEYLESHLTPHFYKEIHQQSITHSVIQKITTENVGKFNPARYCQTYASHLFDFALKTEKKVLEDDQNSQTMKKIANAAEYIEDPSLIFFAKELIGIQAPDEEIVKIVKNAQMKVEERQEKMTARLEQINGIIERRSQALGLEKSLCKFSLTEQKDGKQNIVIEYGFFGASADEVEEIVKKIFDDYESKMANTENEDKKLEHIAEMFQTLEWLHPLKDGQGRTDLILLSKELCRHGFNPVILDLPYLSLKSTLPEWVAYLKEGLLEWQEESLRPHRYRPQSQINFRSTIEIAPEELIAIYYV